jgi:hypothetical protein
MSPQPLISLTQWTANVCTVVIDGVKRTGDVEERYFYRQRRPAWPGREKLHLFWQLLRTLALNLRSSAESPQIPLLRA